MMNVYGLFSLALVILCAEAGHNEADIGQGWKHGLPFRRYCNSVNCPQPENPLNGQVSLVDTKVGYSATFACDPGFRMCGAETITCGYDGAWDKQVPICVEPFGRDVANFTFAFGDSVYYFINELANFGDAQIYCENLGGNLLSIDSKAEWDFITCLSFQDEYAAINYRWIGLFNNNGTWEWTNGQTATGETYWYSEPYDYSHCAYQVIAYWGHGRDVFCDLFEIGFICEMQNA